MVLIILKYQSRINYWYERMKLSENNLLAWKKDCCLLHCVTVNWIEVKQ